MIPPLAPGQSDDSQNMVGWKNTFNMRQVTLMNLAASQLALRGQSRHALTCMQNGCTSSPIKSLDILRRNIQTAINKDIDSILKKYLEKFFQPAVNNIRSNLGRDSVNEEHIKEACCKILEEAKAMYCPRSRDSSPYDYSDSETGSLPEYKFGRPGKRKESDTDSETSQSVKRQRRSKGKEAELGAQVARPPVRREGPKWNPERITGGTLFIMGAKANKALGYGQTRGRLYVRHPDLVRYAGDQEDKEWLAQHSLMPATGGKAYLMVLDDIRDLTATDDYKTNPNLQLHELQGFEVPPFIANKVRAYMERARTDTVRVQWHTPSLDWFDLHTSQSMTPPSTALDSAPSTPSDTLQMLECQSASTASSKQSDTIPFVQLPEVSPGSNHSFISGPLAQSPLPLNSSSSGPRVSLSPNLLDAFTSQAPPAVTQHHHHHPSSTSSAAVAGAAAVGAAATVSTADLSHSNLSALLASHIASDNSEEPDF